MRKNYFAKLVKYIKNVYHIERGLNKLSEELTLLTARVK
jgi:UDP-N-acetylglucosamine enolpyruvyl transferase